MHWDMLHSQIVRQTHLRMISRDMYEQQEVASVAKQITSFVD